MKESETNEIDLLLRDLAKRGRAADAASRDTGEHLDPDELSSFAEGVLPAATRSLYTSHLADCDSCRQIVAQLMAASGAPVRAKTESPKSGLWSFISNIFTPKVLRFALPVLSLAIVVGVGFMLTRQPSQSEYVAQANKEGPAPVPETANTPEGAVSKNSSTGLFTIHDSTKKETAEGKKADALHETEQTKTVNEVASADKAKEAKEANETEKAEKAGAKKEADQQPGEPAPAVAGRADVNSPKPQPEVAREKAAGFTKQPAQPEAVDTVSKGEDRKLRDQRDQEEAQTRSAVAKRAPAPASVTARSRNESKNKDKDDDAVATRTVSGRRFRREGDGWIDTGYDASMSLTNVARGSEQYRALTGDEPALRVIAEQLDGQVIVVWKGKGYRIR